MVSYLRPDSLGVAVGDVASPAVGVRLDQEQATTGGGVDGRRPQIRGTWGTSFRAGVRHLDTEAVGQEEQRQAEVPAGEAAVTDRVGRKLGGDEGDGTGGVGVVREARPLRELLHGELAGEASAASRAAETQGQLADGSQRRLRLVGEAMVSHGVSVVGRMAR